MFIPIGDNIERRTFPLVTVILIVVNALVFVIQVRTGHDAMDAAEAGKTAWAAPGTGTQPLARAQSYDFADYEDNSWESAYEDDSPWAAEINADQAANLAAQKAQYEFIKRWGLTPAELRQGQVMGLLTHMFLHGDIFHLLGNMIMLWAFACALEAGFGHLTFLGFYLLFGFAGGLAQFATDTSSEIPLVGASGAIAGLIGAYTVLYGPLARLKILFFFFYRAFIFEIPAAAFGFGWFLLQLLEASADTDGMGGVAWLAHIGGFLAGVGVTYVCRHDTQQEITADANGKLLLQEKAPATTRAIAAMQPSLPAPPSTCPYCHGDLSNGHQLAPNLIRCGNPSCERMVYLELTPPSELAVAGRRR